MSWFAVRSGDVSHRSRRGFLVVLAVVAIVVAAGFAGIRSERRPADQSGSQSVDRRSPAAPRLGPLGPRLAVGPSVTDPLAGLDRDAGLSVQLSDGSLLWLFGDTVRRSPTGELLSFVIGTAAWASADSPTTTLDHSVDGDPVSFAEPTEAFLPCPRDAPVAGMWPASAVVVPGDGVDRVLVWLSNVCLGDGGLLVPLGMAVGQWWYDPEQPPAGAPVQVEILEQNLFPLDDPDEPLFGAASLLGDDGLVYTFSCRTAGELDADSGGDCYLARVVPEGVSQADAYAVWDGNGFTPDRAEAVPMVMPAGELHHPIPPGQVSVARHDASDRYVMAYSPWPGWSDSVDIRIAVDPWGPWSKPATLRPPGCADAVGERTFTCYTANRQPFMDAPDVLGIGYYDSLVAPGAHPGGSFVVAQVPFPGSVPR